jgi:Flp pilus assembly protein TadD
LRRLDPASLLARLAPRRRTLVYMSVWVVAFAVIQTLTNTDQQLSRHNKLGLALLGEGRTEAAIQEFRDAARLAPNDFWAHENLGIALMEGGHFAAAVAPLRRSLALRPAAGTHQTLAYALAASGRPQDAVESYREAIRLEPDSPEILTGLAWLRATHPDPRMRDPEEAIRLAARAAELTGRADPTVLDTLAAAYAAAGRFDEALRTAERAEALAVGPAPALAAEIRARRELYRAGRGVISGAP